MRRHCDEEDLSDLKVKRITPFGLAGLSACCVLRLRLDTHWARRQNRCVQCAVPVATPPLRPCSQGAVLAVLEQLADETARLEWNPRASDQAMRANLQDIAEASARDSSACLE